ncbi:hypothetical protein CFC21_094921 [Triticum aestivum]|uniref:BTB domain-containing protein n=2 Tax=Triticum aestivum TaxID=4565 RepID=A0A9R1MX36_WHEAT|nr:BTB/POZ and MATH domain-containing protein 2-like [Triticum aestivum]KAF7092427.1 hypothetical protein CFC21_094913 [Triticum aestivum]KAF7092437.1 hypothetical protein CFC21_094921 [Triticum aestivum]
MSSFAGVSVVEDGGLCDSTVAFINTSSECGYHLLVVENYSRTNKSRPTSESVTSREFGVGGHCWLIKCFPNGKSTDCADFVSLDVVLDDDDDGKTPVKAKFTFSFIDQVEMQNPLYVGQAETCSFPSKGSSWGYDRFVRKDAVERSMNLEAECFTIRCDIMVCNTEDDDAAGHGNGVRLPDICHHFNNLLQTKVGADVTFEVSGETFPAHRCVLAARSKVFMAQLFGPMKETSTVIHIKDMEAKVFRALLSFIYTDSFPGMEMDDMEDDETEVDEMRLQWLQDLLVAADRYDLQRLKFICEMQLSENIQVSSVASTLVLAEQHHCSGLKEACFKFIQAQSPSCLQTLMASHGWQHILATYPLVLNELIAKLIALNQK